MRDEREEKIIKNKETNKHIFELLLLLLLPYCATLYACGTCMIASFMFKILVDVSLFSHYSNIYRRLWSQVLAPSVRIQTKIPPNPLHPPLVHPDE